MFANRRETARILVIEHDAWVRADTVAQLTGAGYQVRDASNGFTGLRLARGARPDVIMLGEALPDVAARQVREELEGDPGMRSVRVIAFDLNCPRGACPVTAVRQALDVRSV